MALRLIAPKQVFCLISGKHYSVRIAENLKLWRGGGVEPTRGLTAAPLSRQNAGGSCYFAVSWTPWTLLCTPIFEIGSDCQVVREVNVKLVLAADGPAEVQLAIKCVHVIGVRTIVAVP